MTPGRIPIRLRRREVAAALDVTLRQARYLMESGRIPVTQFGHSSWREVTPADLVNYCVENGFPEPDWGAVLEVMAEDSDG